MSMWAEAACSHGHPRPLTRHTLAALVFNSRLLIRALPCVQECRRPQPLEGKLRKEVLRKQPPAKTDMLQFIDTLPQNDDGSARISRLGENGKAAQAAVLQARLKAYFEATAP